MRSARRNWKKKTIDQTKTHSLPQFHSHTHSHHQTTAADFTYNISLATCIYCVLTVFCKELLGLFFVWICPFVFSRSVRVFFSYTFSTHFTCKTKRIDWPRRTKKKSLPTKCNSETEIHFSVVAAEQWDESSLLHTEPIALCLESWLPSTCMCLACERDTEWALRGNGIDWLCYQTHKIHAHKRSSSIVLRRAAHKQLKLDGICVFVCSTRFGHAGQLR